MAHLAQRYPSGRLLYLQAHNFANWVVLQNGQARPIFYMPGSKIFHEVHLMPDGRFALLLRH
jgi:hypothetical protein